MLYTFYRAFFTGRWYIDLLVIGALVVAPLLHPAGLIVVTAFAINGLMIYAEMVDEHIVASTRPEAHSGLDTRACAEVG